MQAQRAVLEREATAVVAKSAGAAQMVCPFSGVITNVDEARQRDHKSGRNYQCARTARPRHPPCSVSLWIESGPRIPTVGAPDPHSPEASPAFRSLTGEPGVQCTGEGAQVLGFSET